MTRARMLRGRDAIAAALVAYGIGPGEARSRAGNIAQALSGLGPDDCPIEAVRDALARWGGPLEARVLAAWIRTEREGSDHG